MAKNPSKQEEQLAIGQNPEEQAHDAQGGAPPREKNDDEDGLDIAAALENADISDHIRQGLVDPSPSVRAQFRKMLAGRPDRQESAPVFRGPFVVQHPFMVSGADIGDASTETTVDGKQIPTRYRITHVMPTPEGRFVPRVLRQGDLPDELMQHLWADGVLKPFEPERPKPVRKALAPRALPRFTDAR